MREQFRAKDLPFSFFDAFDGTHLDFRNHFTAIDFDTFRLNSYRSPAPGEIGCYASHLAIWNLAVYLDEPIVVLEDDCRLENCFRDALRVASTLVESLGFIRIEGFRRSTRALRLEPAYDRVLTVGDFGVHYLRDVPLCLLGYVISPAAAKKLVNASATLKSPVDKFIQRTWEHDVPIYALSPSPVSKCETAGISTIGDRSQKHKDPITIFRRAIYKSTAEVRRAAYNRAHFRQLRKSDWQLRIDIDRLAGFVE